MRGSITTFISYIFDLVALPRPSERLVRGLSAQTLNRLSRPDGVLPYHERAVRALVWELKYHGNARAAALAGGFLSERLLAEAAENISKPLLIPVPMHAARRRERGYNQTELLCEAALKNLDAVFDYAPNILERIKNTTPQQGLMKYKRLRNVKNSMQVKNPARVAGRVCVVVDDVSTTGATLEEAARALRRAGAASVAGVALAQS